jgi:hypothetical protein
MLGFLFGGNRVCRWRQPGMPTGWSHTAKGLERLQLKTVLDRSSLRLHKLAEIVVDIALILVLSECPRRGCEQNENADARLHFSIPVLRFERSGSLAIIRRYAPRLIAGEQLGRCASSRLLLRSPMSISPARWCRGR